jgi:hypothetical protein
LLASTVIAVTSPLQPAYARVNFGRTINLSGTINQSVKYEMTFIR